MFHPKKTIAVLALSAFVLSPFTPTLYITGADMAFAKGDKGGGNSANKGNGGKSGNKASNGKTASGNGNSGAAKITKATANANALIEPKSNHGAIASELKGLNAAHANINALRNASPNSQVGRIAAYKRALEQKDLLQSNVDAALEALAGLQTLTPEELAALYPNDGTLIDQTAYDAAVHAVAAGAASYDGLADLTEEEKIAAYPLPDPVDPDAPPTLDQAAYDAAIAAYAGDKAAYDGLINTTNEEKAAAFPAAYDDAAYQADLTNADTAVTELELQQGAVDGAVEAALSDASGGRTLSPEARAYLDGLLAGKTLTPVEVSEDEALLTLPDNAAVSD